jgi:SAM-dependent methyltransferase
VKIHWTHVTDYVEAVDRVRAVRTAWENDVNPYGDDLRTLHAAQLARRLELGTGTASEDPDPASAFAHWAESHRVTGVRRVVFDSLWGGIVVALDPLLELTANGRPLLVLIHTGKDEPGAQAAAAAFSLVRQADPVRIGSRTAAILDLHRGRLLESSAETGSDEDGGTAARSFRAMWNRFERFWDRLNVYGYLPQGTNTAAWQLSQLPLDAVRDVLDVGCGPGRHIGILTELGIRVTGLDPSIGAVRKAVAGTGARTLVVGDLSHLPYRAESSDLVIAMHMLYNLSDLDQAVREVRRVLRPGGMFAAATSGERHLDEIDTVFDESVRALSDTWTYDRAKGRSVLRFSMENGGELLGRHFRDVRRRDLTLPLEITEGEAALRYLDSMRSWREGNLPRGVAWSDVMREARARIRRQVAEIGHFSATLRETIFLCR